MGLDSQLGRAVAGIGLLAIVGGVVVAFVPSLGPTIPLSLGFIFLVSVAAMVMGIWIARTRWTGGVLEQTETPNPEKPLATSAPGTEIDDMVHELLTYRRGTLETREQIRERVATVAVDVIKYRDDCSESEAVAQLQDGDWTDNTLAASFFTGQTTLPSDSIISDVVGIFADTEAPDYDEVLEATVNAIAAKAGVETPDVDADEADDDEDEVFDTVVERPNVGQQVTEHCTIYDELDTNRWLGAAGLALIAVGIGAFVGQPGLLLVGAVCAGYAAYGRLGESPPVEGLSVEREFDDANPLPGDEVTVRVTVENNTGGFLSDLRLIDRVPPSMYVVDGSPRVQTSLRAGGSIAFEYTLVAERGKYEWPLLVIGRSVSGGREVEAELTTDATMFCVPSLKTIAETPVRQQTSLYSGSVATETPGAGLEFFAVREYQHGDPMRRINWKRAARTGELSTVQYRQELAAKVMLLFDARSSAYVSSEPGAPHALDLSVAAANDVFASLVDAGNLVGVASFDTVPCFLGPSAGDAHEERARLLFATHPALAPLPPELKDVQEHYIDPFKHIQQRLEPGTQIIMFSPLGDDYTATVANRLHSSGHRVTVLSPDPTNDRTVGQRLARVERRMRVNNLRKRDIRIIDWDPREELYIEFERAKQRKSA